MTADFISRRLPRLGPTTAPSILAARDALNTAAADLVPTPEGILERTWRWRDHDADIRYGLFRPLEAVEEADAAIGAILRATGADRTAGARRVAPGTAARWDLHGRLAVLTDDVLDRVPREGEWTLRQTLGHIVSSQRGYTVYTSFHYGRNRREAVEEAEITALEAEVTLPDESDEALGSIADIRARLDETTDSATALAGLTAEDLARPARWAGIPVDVGFRVARPSSHVYEHAIQVDKTLAWLGWQPTEAQRIVRALYDAWGRLETQIWPMDATALAATGPSGRSVDDVLAALATELVSDAASVRTAAEGTA